ncbi:MAG TPA: glycosyltransferase family A protein, partial [Bacteroidaceae bacterium]|nr:glycosyltransferase family A protein [Bacteroidaceae bacterium]
MLTCSLIVPVYNRPNEVDELLQSIQEQTMIPYEIVIVEDGSEISCEQVVKHYASHLPIVYYTKSNGGPGAARNYGAAHATGDYLIILDSDVLLPPHYIQTLTEVLETESIDAFGGP